MRIIVICTVFRRQRLIEDDNQAGRRLWNRVHLHESLVRCKLNHTHTFVPTIHCAIYNLVSSNNYPKAEPNARLNLTI